MLQRDFGSSGLKVSALGLGAGQIGGEGLDDSVAGALLNTALDCGVTLIDTARGYGLSEERIGRHLSHRRSEFVLSTIRLWNVPKAGNDPQQRGFATARQTHELIVTHVQPNVAQHAHVGERLLHVYKLRARYETSGRPRWRRSFMRFSADGSTAR